MSFALCCVSSCLCQIENVRRKQMAHAHPNVGWHFHSSLLPRDPPLGMAKSVAFVPIHFSFPSFGTPHPQQSLRFGELVQVHAGESHAVKIKHWADPALSAFFLKLCQCPCLCEFDDKTKHHWIALQLCEALDSFSFPLCNFCSFFELIGMHSRSNVPKLHRKALPWRKHTVMPMTPQESNCLAPATIVGTHQSLHPLPKEWRIHLLSHNFYYKTCALRKEHSVVHK